jgi:hypothetical protein
MFTFIIFETKEIDKVDINEVEESEKRLFIKSLDEDLTFVRYATQPTFVQNLTTIQGYYNEEQISNILTTSPLWNPRLV